MVKEEPTKTKTNQFFTRQEIDAIIEDRVRLAVEKEVAGIYEDLLMLIWDKLTPILGTMAATTIIQRAISKTAKTFPFINRLEITEDGISFGDLKVRESKDEKEAIKSGFKEMIANLFDILAKLTGNVLISQLLKEVRK